MVTISHFVRLYTLLCSRITLSSRTLLSTDSGLILNHLTQSLTASLPFHLTSQASCWLPLVLLRMASSHLLIWNTADFYEVAERVTTFKKERKEKASVAAWGLDWRESQTPGAPFLTALCLLVAASFHCTVRTSPPRHEQLSQWGVLSVNATSRGMDKQTLPHTLCMH